MHNVIHEYSYRSNDPDQSERSGDTQNGRNRGREKEGGPTHHNNEEFKSIPVRTKERFEAVREQIGHDFNGEKRKQEHIDNVQY